MIIQHVDRSKYPPNLTGEHGAAWEVDLAAARRAMEWPEESDPTICAFVVFAPWAHLAWAYYLIGAIHLRPLPNLKPAKINLPGATHEIIVEALHPETAPNPDAGKFERLHPPNFIGQWVAQARRNPVDLDRAAAAKVRGAVEEILAGKLSPDSDFIREWVKRFSDSNLLDR